MHFKRKVNLVFASLRAIIFLGIIAFSIQDLACQEKDVKSEYEKEFEAFKKSIQEEFIEFKSENDSIFAGFLKNAWKEYELSVDEREVVPKPILQPVVKDEQPATKEIIPGSRKTMMEDTARQLKLNVGPRKYNTLNTISDAAQYTNLNFFGTPIQIPIPKDSLPTLTQVSNKAISNYFTLASENEDLYDIIRQTYIESLQMELNGWGLMKLLQTASDSLYISINDRVLFTWFGLLKCKQNVKVGYDSSNVYLLAAFDVPIYYKPYFESGGQRYYLIEFEDQEKISKRLYSYDSVYPGTKESVALYFKCLPKLESKAVFKEHIFEDKPVSISYDSNMVNYYKSYPDCDISIYFQPPLTEAALLSLDSVIKPNISGKKLIDQVNFILDFVQQAILYQTDDQQFGYENYLFAEELLSAAAADCEDRSIFLSQLIDHYIGLRIIGLEYPGHFTLAVNIPGNPAGYYVQIHDDRYYVCDPTYIGAKTGMLMPRFENTQPEIIIF
jgi:hypothetical protein